ncbi:MAG: restriction endonuclease subunit S [Acidobacteriota bacterium]
MAGEGRRRMPLGEFVTFQRGHDLPEEHRTRGNIPILGSFGVTGCHDEARASGPGVTVGRSGASFGVVSYSPVDYWPLNTALYVIDFHGNDPRFAYYFLRHFDFKRFNSGSAQPSLNRNFVHPVPVEVPPLPEQRAIAHTLGTLDDKIELNRRMNETLEAMARALFKSWFVDFDPVRAKAEGRNPGLPKRLADLFPDRLVGYALGEIPEGWEVVPLPEAIEVNPTRSLRKGEVAPYLDMANMPMKGHTPEALVDRPFGSGMRFINGDTLVARITPCLENGKTAYVDFLQDSQVGWGSTEYLVLRPKPPLPEEFAYCLARNDGFREFAIQSMTGSSGRQRVPAESLSHFLLAMPSEQLASRFGFLLRPLFMRASDGARESRTLAALRDTLLPKLISGELRLRDADKILEATA